MYRRHLFALLALAKARTGKLTYGSAGGGSTFHMSAELFKAQAGVAIVHILYRGGGPALTDTIARLQADMPKWAKLVKERGITAE